MLNCEEFVTLAVHLKKISNDDLLREAFLYFDKDQSGYIEFEELQQALLDDHFGPTNDQIVQDIIFDADLDKVYLNFPYIFLVFLARIHMIFFSSSTYEESLLYIRSIIIMLF